MAGHTLPTVEKSGALQPIRRLNQRGRPQRWLHISCKQSGCDADAVCKKDLAAPVPVAGRLLRPARMRMFCSRTHGVRKNMRQHLFAILTTWFF